MSIFPAAWFRAYNAQVVRKYKQFGVPSKSVVVVSTNKTEISTNALKIGIREGEVLTDLLYHVIFQDPIGIAEGMFGFLPEDKLHRIKIQIVQNLSEYSVKLVNSWLKMETNDGMTFLHHIIQSPNLKFSNDQIVANDLVLKMLLELASPQVASDALIVKNQDGLTPYEFAKTSDCADTIVEILQEWMDAHKHFVDTALHE